MRDFEIIVLTLQILTSIYMAVFCSIQYKRDNCFHAVLPWVTLSIQGIANLIGMIA